MDIAYTYQDPARLYLNVTNRCTNRCRFCVRHFKEGLGGWRLRGDAEPDLSQLLDAVAARGGPGAFREIIWCGFGEPTLRWELILAAAGELRRGGARLRLNTNGHANLVAGGDILPELSRAVDAVSISLNAPTWERYRALCRPDPRSVGREADLDQHLFWDALIDFLTRAPDHFGSVQSSLVGSVLSAEEITACRGLCRERGIGTLRVRG